MSAERLLKVPAGTKPTLCTGHAIGGTCQQPVFWIRDRYGNTPVDCDGEDCQRPSESKDRDHGRILDAAGVASLLGLENPTSENTRRWVTEHVPFKKRIGHRTVRWIERDVVAWVESRGDAA